MRLITFFSIELYDALFKSFFGKTAVQLKEDDDIELYGWAFKMNNTFELESLGQKSLVLKTETKSTAENLLRLGLTQLKKSKALYTPYLLALDCYIRSTLRT